MTPEERLFTRQFLLTTETGLPVNWPSWEIDAYSLYCHPSLEVTEVQKNGARAFLLGFAFSWRHPEWTHVDLLEDALDGFADIRAVLARFDSVSGQYVLVVSHNGQVWISPDACAQREVFYSTDFAAVGSQPKILEKVVEVVEWENSEIREYYNSPGFNRKYGFIGDSTHVSNIRRLTPNHILKLSEKTVERIFPTRKSSPTTRDEVAAAAIERLSGFIKSASLRYKLRVGVTAGYDSRVLFLASLGADVQYYVSKSTSKGNATDIKIAQRLAKAHNVALEITSYGNEGIPEKDKEIQRKSVDFPMFRRLGAEPDYGTLIVNGNISEIARNYFHISGDITASLMAQQRGDQHVDFVVDYYRDWMARNEGVFNRFGYDILDMLYWEDKMANWKAKAKTSAAWNRESWSPFNCRELLEILLSSDRNDRDAHNNQLYNRIISMMSPEAAKIPINPTNKIRIIRMMKALGIYMIYRRFAQMLGRN